MTTMPPNKVEVTRKVSGDVFATRNNAVPLGVVAYGHDRRDDCADIEVIAPVGTHNATELSGRISGIAPRGMTPITDALSPRSWRRKGWPSAPMSRASG